jgi:hypothetical protein
MLYFLSSKNVVDRELRVTLHFHVMFPNNTILTSNFLLIAAQNQLGQPLLTTSNIP